MDNFILNGAAHGDVATALLAAKMDPGVLRPFIGSSGMPYKTFTVNGKQQTVLAMNAPASLRKDEWKMLDDAVMDAVYTTPMRMWADLRAQGNVIRIPNGMGKTIYEYQRATDIGPATTSMDGVRESSSDRPNFDLTGIPLPIIHKDFQFSLREVEISRNNGPALDTMMARLATRKVLEEAEKYTVGSQTYSFGGYNIYGYTNFPARMTQSITAPSSSNHATTVSEIIAMRKKLTDKGYGGPFTLYASPGWDAYLDEDYSTTKGDNTFRSRILALDGIDSIKTSYWLTGNALILAQRSPEVAQAVVGMDVTTVQWQTKGGMELNFKVMAIMVPLLRSDINGITGIVHGS